jgi:hypothetical protein
MAVKKGKKATNKAKTLATRTLPGKRAGDVKDGVCSGAHYKNVIIEMRKAGSDPKATGGPF